ncbi:MAG: hypothetical protein IPH30_07290 [Betaproteobacteria bacterium]|nr:hypothetical protein [Betaproteobacteria bacterium]
MKRSAPSTERQLGAARWPAMARRSGKRRRLEVGDGAQAADQRQRPGGRVAEALQDRAQRRVDLHGCGVILVVHERAVEVEKIAMFRPDGLSAVHDLDSFRGRIVARPWLRLFSQRPS